MMNLIMIKGEILVSCQIDNQMLPLTRFRSIKNFSNFSSIGVVKRWTDPFPVIS